jgi:hypothetical protein
VRVEEVLGGNWRGRRRRGMDVGVDGGWRWASNWIQGIEERLGISYV